jgi:hypothetical protein
MPATPPSLRRQSSLLQDVTNSPPHGLQDQLHRQLPKRPKRTPGGRRTTTSHVIRTPLAGTKRQSLFGTASPSDDPFASPHNSDTPVDEFGFPTTPPSPSNSARKLLTDSQKCRKRARLSLGGGLGGGALDAPTPNFVRRISVHHGSAGDFLRSAEKPHRVSDRLAVGGRLLALSRAHLKANQVTHILSLDDTAARHPDHFTYKHIPFENDEFDVVLGPLLEAAEYVAACASDESIILLLQDHDAGDCASAVLVTYFILHQKLTFDDALEKLARIGGLGLENENFLTQLRFLDSEVWRLVVRAGTLESQYEWWLWSSDGQRDPTARELELGSILKDHDRRLTQATETVEKQVLALQHAEEREKEAGNIVKRVTLSARELIETNKSELHRTQLDLAAASDRVQSLEASLLEANAARADDARRIGTLEQKLKDMKAENVEYLQCLLEDVTSSEQNANSYREELDAVSRQRGVQAELNKLLESELENLQEQNDRLIRDLEKKSDEVEMLKQIQAKAFEQSFASPRKAQSRRLRR